MSSEDGTPETVAPEWSLPLEAANLSGGEKMKIAPNETERRLLARRLGLVSLDSLEAQLKISRESGGSNIHIHGKIGADVTQTCVVTGESVKNTLSENFDAWFADPQQAVSFVKARHEKMKRAGQSEMPVLEENEDPEAIIDGKIDVGELVVQYLSLAIDPYPHAPGAEKFLEERLAREKTESPYKNPFAALKEWKDRFGTENS